MIHLKDLSSSDAVDWCKFINVFQLNWHNRSLRDNLEYPVSLVLGLLLLS